jgi:hypothetical protein
VANVLVFHEVVGVDSLLQTTNDKHAGLRLFVQLGAGIFFEIVRAIVHKIIRKFYCKSSGIIDHSPT